MKQDLQIWVSAREVGFDVRVIDHFKPMGETYLLKEEYFSEYSDAVTAAKFLSVEHCAAIKDITQFVPGREVKPWLLMNGTPQKSVI
tara:strand:+ start:674 stop:934 length:261 start_codon:yes stop_codon:yes gene_type:complete